MNFMFSCQEQYLTRSLRSLMRYCSCHSNIKFISSRHRVISSIYFTVWNIKKTEFYSEGLLHEIGLIYLWVTFLAETSKDLEIILITIVLTFTKSLSRTSLHFSPKTSFVYSNLFIFAKFVAIRYYIQTSKRVRSPSSACKKARASAENYNQSITSLLPLAAML